MSIPISQFITSPPPTPFPPLVSIRLFSTSVSHHVLVLCRSTSFAYYSKNKDEMKRQRHLSLLKYTYLQRNEEATVTILTALTEISGWKAQQLPTFISYLCLHSRFPLFQEPLRVLCVENEPRVFSESTMLASLL